MGKQGGAGDTNIEALPAHKKNIREKKKDLLEYLKSNVGCMDYKRYRNIGDSVSR